MSKSLANIRHSLIILIAKIKSHNIKRKRSSNNKLKPTTAHTPHHNSKSMPPLCHKLKIFFHTQREAKQKKLSRLILVTTTNIPLKISQKKAKKISLNAQRLFSAIRFVFPLDFHHPRYEPPLTFQST